MKTEYLIVLAVSIAAPFVLSFSRKLDFYRYPVRLVLSIGLPFALFALWDIFVTARGHWAFSNDYTIGFRILQSANRRNIIFYCHSFLRYFHLGICEIFYER